MINHVVLFKLKEMPAAEKETALQLLKSALENLFGKIEQLRFIEVGLNHALETASFDLCLISHFDNLDDLETYRVHPEHQKVVALFQQYAVQRAAVDYEF